MKFVPVLLAAANLLSAAVGFNLVAREVLGFDIQRRQLVNPLEHDKLRRRQTVQAGLDNYETLYLLNATLGTPAQYLRLHIDTGSSDLWANSAQSSLCTSHRNTCRGSGTYDANSSSTYEYVNSQFNISYADGSGATGDYAKDDFSMGGKTIKGLQFGIGYDSSSTEGVLGIGYPVNEAISSLPGQRPYANLPQSLKDSGTIGVNAYSLWLNDLDASTGSILFGGVDMAKFEGYLRRLPIIPLTSGDKKIYTEFVIALTGLGSDGQANTIFKDQPIPVLLDSGTSLSYLPNNVVSVLYQQYNATYNEIAQGAYIDCNLASSGSTIEFTFSGATISVPLDELVLPQVSEGYETMCIFGISPANGAISILGDTFLRSAYVVYDIDNNEIALGQTKFNASQSEVREIDNGDRGIPNASGVPGAVSSLPVGTMGHYPGPSINPTIPGPRSTAAAMPAATFNPWMGGAAVAGAGIMAGFNGL